MSSSNQLQLPSKTGAIGPELAAADVGKIRRAWRRHLEREHTAATAETYSRALGRFEAWLSAQDPAPTLAIVTREDVLTWREQIRRQYSRATVNLYLSALRAFYAWAIDRGAPIVNPAAGIKARGRQAMTPHAREVLTDGEVLALLASCYQHPIGRRDRAIFSLAAYCALRGIEIQRGQVGDLETRDGRLILWVWGKGRDGPDDFVVVPPAAEADLRAWLAVHPSGSGPLFCTVGSYPKGRSLSLRSLRAIWRSHANAARITGKRKTFHSLRHSAITNAIRHEASPLQVQRMARHSDIKTTLGYYHESDRLEDPPEDRIDYSEEEGER